MHFFIDSADPDQVREAYSLGFVSGVTTNPTLAAKTGRPYPELVHEILGIVGANDPVSLEVVATEPDEMIREAHSLNQIDKRVVVKIPATKNGFKVTSILSKQGIRVNMTLVFSALQALAAAEAGAYFVSPFVGRIDDATPNAGANVVKQIKQIYQNYDYKTQILFASVRRPEHVLSAAMLGAENITAPLEILNKLTAHHLTDIGLEQFLQDWEQAGLKLPVSGPNSATSLPSPL